MDKRPKRLWAAYRKERRMTSIENVFDSIWEQGFEDNPEISFSPDRVSDEEKRRLSSRHVGRSMEI
jgi:hypothetical protein